MSQNNEDLQKIKEEIISKIVEYYRLKGDKKFVPSVSRINYAGTVSNEKEAISMLDAILDGWLGLGPKAREFSKAFSEYLGVSKTCLVNSGSSANLLSISALMSKKIKGPLEKGDEVITSAVTFPTTLNPIIQNALKPVFVDVELGTYNVDVEKLKEAITDKTRLIMLPHTLGNPNNMDAIMDIAEDYNLYLIEDNCDALGSEFNGKKTGSFGVLSTCSFYPAHHITTGEGGAVSIPKEDPLLYRVVRSLRDWGRDCWCESDEKSINGACGRRFEWLIDGIKYDHKYIYSHIGYNLKPTEIQAAMGLEQLKKLDEFNDKRKRNFKYLYENLKKYEDYIILPKKHEKADPAWFAFPITLKEDAPFSRIEIIKFLEENKIQTRLIFGGNITKQPAYKGCEFKIHSSLGNSDQIMKNAFFIGVYPGIGESELQYIIQVFEAFFSEVKK
ncbi:MAG: lipopolysaccharide biosynthesis protein RfbH [Thermoplasmatales archaeon]|nr:lipopolysaccharide biosynthesis protein RfbH [Thermoplasmatales archaeon]